MLRFWKEDKMARLLLKISDTSKGRPLLILLESCSSGLFGYSFSVQQSSHTLFLNQLSSWIQLAAEDGNDGSPSKWKAMQDVENMNICAFSPILCLPVLFLSIMVSQAANASPASLQRNTGRQHTAAVCTQVIMWPTQPITGQCSHISKPKYT